MIISDSANLFHQHGADTSPFGEDVILHPGPSPKVLARR
jgi:hypothetical protein